MAWRPSQYLIDGELDNTTPGKITGWMRFAGLNDKVTFDLRGNFHRDIRGAKIRFHGNGLDADADQARQTMAGIAIEQTGNAGDITAGRPPADYVDYPYFEWYSQMSGRVVIELQPDQLEVVGQPIPSIESDPISRDQQNQNMSKFMTGMLDALNEDPPDTDTDTDA